MLKITLKKSPIGYEESQKLTVKALGLGKISSFVVQPDNHQIRGMVRKVRHLVVVEEVEAQVPGGES